MIIDKASTVLLFSSQVALPTRKEFQVLSGNSSASGLLQKKESVMLSSASCGLVPGSTYLPLIHIAPFLPPESVPQRTLRPSYHSTWLYQGIKIHSHSFCNAILSTVPLKYLPWREDYEIPRESYSWASLELHGPPGPLLNSYASLLTLPASFFGSMMNVREQI